MNKITVIDIQKKKQATKKISVLTAYDYLTAKLIDEAGFDIILVGDSLSGVVLGHENTLKVTLEEMLHHTKAVTTGNKNALIVADMPFMSYGVSLEQTLTNAGRFIKEGLADAVKLEGAGKIAKEINSLVTLGIPVMGHLGLTPQHVLTFGGYKVQGKSKHTYAKILADAKIIEESGAFAVVLECVPAELAKEITASIAIPTIGIGAGINCDGQVLVSHDLLGLSDKHKPKFVKQYADLKSTISKAFAEFKDDIEKRKYPSDEHSY